MSSLMKIEKLERKGKLINKFKHALKELKMINEEIGNKIKGIEEIKEKAKK